MGRENTIWGREKCKNGREKKYNGQWHLPLGVALGKARKGVPKQVKFGCFLVFSNELIFKVMPFAQISPSF